jgi:hypothetical protein
MIDTNYKYAQWSTNVNVIGMNWQTYHEGGWFNPAEKTYDQAIEEFKEIIRLKVLKDHPHLIAFDKQNDVVKINGAPVSANKSYVNVDEIKFNDPIEKINKGAIEEPYDIIKEIDSCKSLTVLKIYEKQCKTPAQKSAYEKKVKELESGAHPIISSATSTKK